MSWKEKTRRNNIKHQHPYNKFNYEVQREVTGFHRELFANKITQKIPFTKSQISTEQF